MLPTDGFDLPGLMKLIGAQATNTVKSKKYVVQYTAHGQLLEYELDTYELAKVKAYQLLLVDAVTTKTEIFVREVHEYPAETLTKEIAMSQLVKDVTSSL